MRLGISSSLNAENAEKWAQKLTDLGCKSVVFPLDSGAPDDLIEEYVREAKKHDLLIAEVGIWRNALALDPVERKKNLEYSIKQLLLAEKVGARCCVNIAGAFGPKWDGGYKENFSKEARKETVKMIQTLLDEVQPKNTWFTLEPMPWMLPTGPEEYLELIEEVDRERFAVHMDIINMINCPERYFFNEDFVDHTFELLGDRIKSCHLKDIRLLEHFTFNLLECACGDGTFNIKHYLEAATKADPDMPMLLEHLDNDEAYKKSFRYIEELIG